MEDPNPHENGRNLGVDHNDSIYQLSVTLRGHTSDVRAVAGSHSSCVLSASRDFTAKLWVARVGGIYDPPITFTGPTNYVIAAVCTPRTVDFPTGLFVTAGYDKKIYVYMPDSAEPLFTLSGHSEAVTSLFSLREHGILSSSCDGSAILWDLISREEVCTYSGHPLPVWAVIFLTDNFVVTGCADKFIRVFLNTGLLHMQLDGHTDCVRSLSPITNCEFLSASNDTTVRRWSAYTGQCLQVFAGHPNFVYSVSMSPQGGFFASCGEDRSILVWTLDGACEAIRTPAMSVWSVTVLENGDIATGSCDGVIRIYTKARDRIAEDKDLILYSQEVDEADRQALENSSARHTPLDSPRANGTATSSEPPSQEASPGVNQAAYDYMFSIDVEDGKPPLKLFYKKTTDPYDAAKKFIDEHGLPYAYTQQIVDFIRKNAETPIEDVFSNAPSFVDPFTGASRYIPVQEQRQQDRELSAPSSVSGSNVSDAVCGNLIPHTEVIAFEAANIEKIREKLLEFAPPSEYSEANVEKLISLATSDDSPTEDASKILDSFLQWPQDKIFPVLDVTRLAMRKPLVNSILCSSRSGNNLMNFLLTVIHTDQSQINKMLSVKIICNMLKFEAGENLFRNHKESIMTVMKIILEGPMSKPMQIAVTTFYLNCTVLYTTGKEFKEIDLLIDFIQTVLNMFSDEEALFRLMISLGTCYVTHTKPELMPSTLNFLKREVRAKRTKKLADSCMFILREWEKIFRKAHKVNE